MDIIQIIGPSYSGSTVLGYALNTIDGFFFGSEVRRLLKSERKTEKKEPQCDICGKNCQYWNADALNHISRIDDLNGLYSYFSEHNPDVKYFVDASKLTKYYRNADAEKRIICTKHPVRLVASTIYNNKGKYGIKSDSYPEFQAEINKNPDIADILNAIIKDLLVKYSSIFEDFPEGKVFRNDCAHIDNFKEFRNLENFIGVDENSISSTNYSNYTCHSIGGNRAPVWIAQDTLAKKGSTQRKQYYSTAESFGDWKIDNKYKHLMGERILDIMDKNKDYHLLSGILNYKHSDILYDLET